MARLVVALFLIFVKEVCIGHAFLKRRDVALFAPFSFSPATDSVQAAKFDVEPSVAQTLGQLQDIRQHAVEEPGSTQETSYDYNMEAEQKSAEMAKSIEGIAKGCTTRLTEEIGADELPAGPSPQEEKESKARGKGGFMSNKSSSASETFSNANIQAGGIGADQSIRDDKRQILEAIASDTKPEKVTKEDMEELIGFEQGPPGFPEETLRDYSFQCPEDFFPVSTQCHARDDYKGPCAKIQKDLYKLSPTAKASWAKSCGSDWPPLPAVCEKGTNYGYPCPITWVYLGEGVCQNPKKYGSGRCSTKVQFGLMSSAEKRKFEQDCGERWPCRPTACEKNYNTICPDDWKHVGGFFCDAPSTYTGPCSKRQNMLETIDNIENKINFEISCATAWGCYPYSCDRNYEARCPLGWLLLEDNTCKAPFTFVWSEKCPRLINFSNLEPEARESLAAACQLDFPCKYRDSCKTDFYSRCPVNWIDLGDGKSCQAPKNYDGHCDTIMNFADMSVKEKESKMSECSLEWPCIGEWRQSPLNTHL